MKSIRVKPQQGDQRAEKLHSTLEWGGSHGLPNSSRGKKVSQDTERKRREKKRKKEKKIPHPAFSCQQCEVPRD